jgi:hypothetical protein
MTDSPYCNLDNSALADELGAVNAELRRLERRKELLRKAILQRSIDLIRGARFEVPVVQRTRSSLDENAMRADMGDDWVERYVRRTTYYELRPLPVLHG